MKNSKICPKCNSDEIIIVPGKRIPAENGRNIMIGSSVFSSALFDRYVCSDCGYSEEYFDENEIKKLKDKFETNN